MFFSLALFIGVSDFAHMYISKYCYFLISERFIVQKLTLLVNTLLENEMVTCPHMLYDRLCSNWQNAGTPNDDRNLELKLSYLVLK